MLKIIFVLLVFGLLNGLPLRADEMEDMAFFPPEACDKAFQWTDTISPEQANVIYAVVGDRNHRMEHALWHASRSGFDPSSQPDITSAYGSDWINPHALCGKDNKTPPNALGPNYNPAGEDFLYMHRAMIGEIRQALIAAKLPCLRGWTTPLPDQSAWPIPDYSTHPSENKDAKSDETRDLLKSWDLYFQDANSKAIKWRRQISLSQLGFAIEFTVHNNLHMRYASLRPLPEFQSPDGQDGANIPLNGIFNNWIFDLQGYDWLADPYGAAVNPIFWKIHGYVDNLLNRWLKDNNKKLGRSCDPADATCYSWKGTWTGKMLNINPPSTATNAGSGIKAGRYPQNPNSGDVTFKKKRMALTQMGVVHSAEGGTKNPPRAEEPMDPYETAVNSVCSPQQN